MSRVKELVHSTKTKFAAAGTALGVSAVAGAAGLASSDFGTIQADIIATIVVAAAIGVAIMSTGIGWDVGMSLVKKFVKKGAK